MVRKIMNNFFKQKLLFLSIISSFLPSFTFGMEEQEKKYYDTVIVKRGDTDETTDSKHDEDCEKIVFGEQKKQSRAHQYLRRFSWPDLIFMSPKEMKQEVRNTKSLALQNRKLFLDVKEQSRIDRGKIQDYYEQILERRLLEIEEKYSDEVVQLIALLQFQQSQITELKQQVTKQNLQAPLSLNSKLKTEKQPKKKKRSKSDTKKPKIKKDKKTDKKPFDEFADLKELLKETPKKAWGSTESLTGGPDTVVLKLLNRDLLREAGKPNHDYSQEILDIAQENNDFNHDDEVGKDMLSLAKDTTEPLEMRVQELRELMASANGGANENN